MQGTGMSAALVLSGPTRSEGLSAVGATFQETVREVGRIRIPEFLLFFLMFMYPLLVKGGSLIGNVLILLVSVYGLTKKPALELGKYTQLVWLILPALVYIATVSSTQEHVEFAYSWSNRFIRISAVLLFAFVAAVGRLDLRSGILGFLAACLLNVPLFYLGLVSNEYGGLLTGIFGDKNVSGLAYAIAVVFAYIYIDNPFFKWLNVGVLVFALWQTGSRTSMGALVGAFVWFLVTPHLNNFLGKLFVAWFIYWGIGYLTDEYSQAGVFEDRVGSDALRERIDEASRLKLDATGFWGRGLGEAVVELQDNVWFFHNSYWAALVEGGWPWLALCLILTVVVMIPFWRRAETSTQVAAEGLGLIILISSSRLGEVFLTTYWALAFATCLYFRLSPIDQRTTWEKYADAERERRQRERNLWSGADRSGRDWRADHAARVREIQEAHIAAVARPSRWGSR